MVCGPFSLRPMDMAVLALPARQPAGYALGQDPDDDDDGDQEADLAGDLAVPGVEHGAHNREQDSGRRRAEQDVGAADDYRDERFDDEGDAHGYGILSR